MENEDDNKVFSITFRTPPKDSTDCLIYLNIQYSAVRNSTKSPSLNWQKALNTFLNAFTFGDKTMYPVASRNERILRI